MFPILISCTFQAEYFLFKRHILRFSAKQLSYCFYKFAPKDVAVIRGIKHTFAQSYGDNSLFSYSDFCLLPNMVYDKPEYCSLGGSVFSVIPSFLPCCQGMEASFESSGKMSRSRFPATLNIPVNAWGEVREEEPLFKMWMRRLVECRFRL